MKIVLDHTPLSKRQIRLCWIKKTQGINAIVLVSDENSPDLEEPDDSVDIVVFQILIWLKALEAQKINSYLSFY